MVGFFSDEQGATAIEYGLITALVCVAMVVGLRVLNAATTNMYTSVTTTVETAMGGAP